MRRLAAHASEVIKRIYKTAAEVMMPNAIYGAAPGEGVVWMREPVGESCATGAFAGVRKRERKVEGRDRAGFGDEAGFWSIALELVCRSKHVPSAFMM